MKLLKLRVVNFRNYREAAVEPGPGVNLFLGPNGSGKSNLAEAVSCLSLGRGWRTREIAPLIRDGEKEALIEAKVEVGELRHDIELVFSKSGRRLLIDGHPAKRLADLFSLVSVFSYAPEDASFFKDAPSVRRSFLDIAISKRSEEYFSLVRTYAKLLDERNALLRAERVDELALDVMTERLAACAIPIDEHRKAFIEELEKGGIALLDRLRGTEKNAKLRYRPFLKEGTKDEALALFRRSRASDLEHRSTGVGVQREDFALVVDGLDIGVYGSQGENRLASIAFKLVPALLAEERRRPIVILDDAYSELDERRSDNLKGLLGELGQCFIAATSFQYEGASRFDISDGTIVREE